MLRRCRFLLQYEKFEGISGDKGLMTYQQACTIFGFQMSDRLEKKEVKKRFNQLALKYHPDNGGTSEQFQLLKEAHRIMMTHRHDRGVDSKKGDANFRHMNYDDLTNTIHRQTAERKEYRSFGLQDFAVFTVFITVATTYYLYRTYKTQEQILKGRWSYTEDQIQAEPNVSKGEHVWHPWRADRETRDRMDDIGVLQNSIRQEVVDEKRAKAPPVHTPWQYGGPFARGKVVPYSDEAHDTPIPSTSQAGEATQ